MLAGEMVILFVEQDSLRSAWVVEDGASEFFPVVAADHQRADRVGAVIDAKGEGRLFREMVFDQILNGWMKISITANHEEEACRNSRS